MSAAVRAGEMQVLQEAQCYILTELAPPEGRKRKAKAKAATAKLLKSGDATGGAKWTDPKENSLQLHLVPSPARSRRSVSESVHEFPASEAGETHRKIRALGRWQRQRSKATRTFREARRMGLA
eukprot:g24259.t1